MGVPGEGEGDRRMPCDRRNICRRNPIAEHVRYGSVPEVVEPHSLQARGFRVGQGRVYRRVWSRVDVRPPGPRSTK